MKNLFQYKTRVRKLEKSLGLSHLPEPFKNVYAFISFESTTRSAMMRSDFLKELSMSTIKRAVDQLTEEGLIKSIKCEVDARKRILIATRG